MTNIGQNDKRVPNIVFQHLKGVCHFSVLVHDFRPIFSINGQIGGMTHEL